MIRKERRRGRVVMKRRMRSELLYLILSNELTVVERED